MPHDRYGQPLAMGDLVMVPCHVLLVQPGEDYCNLSLETVLPMHPGTYLTAITVNSRQVERIGYGQTAHPE